MDFIDGLPKSEGYDVIYVAMDRLRKYAHFIPLKHPYTTAFVAERFITNIVKLHGCLIQLFRIETEFSPANFGKRYFAYKGQAS